MGIDEVLISALPGDVRAAALDHGQLVRFVVSGGSDEVRCGDVFMGIAVGRPPGVAGVLVDLGRGPPGLLMTGDTSDGCAPSPGSPVLVRIVREAEVRKGPKLSGRFTPPVPQPPESVSPPCRIDSGQDPIAVLLRDATQDSTPHILVDDATTLVRLRAAVPPAAPVMELWTGRQPLFAETGVDEMLESALTSPVTLPSGARLWIDETRALTAIDVDTGQAAAVSARAAALACDLDAAAAIGRLIGLRDLAGLIVIDFVPLRRPAERHRIGDAVAAALPADGRQVRIGGWTRLGLFELVRERSGPSLQSRIAGPCEACGAGAAPPPAPSFAAGTLLRSLLAESRGGLTPGGLPKGEILVSPAIAAALRGPLAAAQAHVEECLGAPIPVRIEPSLPRDRYCRST